MINILTVGFQTEEQVAKWLDGDDFSYIIYYNEVANKHFNDLDGSVNKIVGDLLQELGGISYYIYRGKDYINGINNRLTEMVNDSRNNRN